MKNTTQATTPFISVVLSREYFANLDPDLMEVIEEILEGKLPGSEVEVCVWAKSRADQPTIIQASSEERRLVNEVLETFPLSGAESLEEFDKFERLQQFVGSVFWHRDPKVIYLLSSGWSDDRPTIVSVGEYGSKHFALMSTSDCQEPIDEVLEYLHDHNLGFYQTMDELMNELSAEAEEAYAELDESEREGQNKEEFIYEYVTRDMVSDSDGNLWTPSWGVAIQQG